VGRNGDCLGVGGATAVRELVLDVPGESTDAGLLGVSVVSLVVENDGVVVDAPEVSVMGVSDGACTLVFPVDGCGNVGGEYRVRNGVVVGCPVRSFSAEGLARVVADGRRVQT
jgi:hypothetical protein